MATKSRLARRLQDVAGFADPRVDLEQYRTPSELAAQLVHTADLQGDVAGRTVLDLGCGTGILALAAGFRGPDQIVGIDIGPGGAVDRPRERAPGRPAAPVAWVRGDATRGGLCVDGATVLANPPFGAQDGNRHADRRFLETTARLASVSYTVHNAGSQSFLEAFAADHGGRVTHAYAAAFDLPNSFAFHREQRRTIDVEVVRIDWTR